VGVLTRRMSSSNIPRMDDSPELQEDIVAAAIASADQMGEAFKPIAITMGLQYRLLKENGLPDEVITHVLMAQWSPLLTAINGI
jgi:hypothetical protein